MLAAIKNILSKALPVPLVRAGLVLLILWLVLPAPVLAWVVCVAAFCLWSVTCVLFGRWTKTPGTTTDPFGHVSENRLFEMITGRKWEEPQASVTDTQTEETRQEEPVGSRYGGL